MDDPQRLLNGTGTPLEQALLQELRSYGSTAEMRAHTLAMLGITGSASLATGTLASLWGKICGTKLLLTISVSSVLLGVPAAYLILRHAGTPAAPAPRTVAAMASVQQLPASAPSTVPRALDAPPTPPPVARSSRRSAATNADLRAELEALDPVRSTLARGDFFGALSLLDAYFGNFHHGRLHLEAEILRIDALARCGKVDAARSYAKEFLRRYPKSVHAARLQAIVGN